MRRTILPSVLACSLACAVAWPQSAFASAPSKAKSGKKGSKKSADPAPSGGVPEADAGDDERVGRVFIDADGLGEAGPVLAGRSTKVAEGALTSESVTLTDAPAGPELRITLTLRDSGGYAANYEIVYDNKVIEDGTGGFECQLCTEDELIEKVEALAKQVAPKLVVPKDPEPEESGGGTEQSGDGGTQTSNGSGTDEPEFKEPNGTLRAAGIPLVVVGGLATVSGIVMVVRQPTLVTEGDRAGQVLNTRPLGGAAIGAGVVLVAVGATLWGIYGGQKKNPKPVALNPWLGRGSGGLSLTGRF